MEVTAEVLCNELVQGQLSLLTPAQHFPHQVQDGCSETSVGLLVLHLSTPAAGLIRLSTEVAWTWTWGSHRAKPV